MHGSAVHSTTAMQADMHIMHASKALHACMCMSTAKALGDVGSCSVHVHATIILLLKCMAIFFHFDL